MVFTTYPLTPERPVTRAEIDRLTVIIEQLKAVIARYAAVTDTDFATIRRLRHEIDVQVARARVAEAVAGRAQALETACRAALDWYALDGDGISEPTRGVLLQALGRARDDH